ncbi:TPA: hypothetical protein ACQXLH_002049, partial [Streptococcus pneumoniae]
KQARARLEQKPDANRIERRAYRTIAGMQWEYAPQAHLNGAWKHYTGWGNRRRPEPPFNTPAHTFEVGWFNSEEEARRIAPPPDWAEYRIVRRLVSKPEVVE